MSPLRPTVSVSTKHVHGLWITMWMSGQYHVETAHLTDCPIGRQYNPCNSIEMRSCRKNVERRQAPFPYDQKDFLLTIVQNCAQRQDGTRLAKYSRWPIARHARY